MEEEEEEEEEEAIDKQSYAAIFMVKNHSIIFVLYAIWGGGTRGQERLKKEGQTFRPPLLETSFIRAQRTIECEVSYNII